VSDVLIFVGVFVGLFVFRFVAATVIFFWILPAGDRCPNCDAVTLRIQSVGWSRLVPRFRRSWCLDCGWEGMLRGRSAPPPLNPTVARRGTVPDHHS
jgi:hypothetical protein